MKKYLYILTALLLGAVSCSVDGPSAPEQKENDGKVTLLMKVTLPEPIEVTKSTMADQPSIDNLYVAVFGTDGYLNDYTRAVRCDENGENLSQDWSDITNGMNFYFQVTLTATQSLRRVHIIANGPDQLDFNSYENQLMLHLFKSGTADAYWQYFELPNGTAKADGETPSDEAVAAFSNVKLIRNFAKVSVSVAGSVDNFTLTGFNVYNTATAGSIAIWDGSKYITDYHTYSTVKALQEVYPNGFVPEEAEYDSTAPTTTEEYNTTPKYVYERPAGSDNSSRPYIILKGRFKGDMMDTYYRLDFVNRDGEYLPLYRNFEYSIILTSVAKSGVTDPAKAKASNSNVSSLEETQNLSDIADGVSRLYVMWLDHTYLTAQNNVAFKYMYLRNAATDTESTAATLSFISGEGAAITSGTGWNNGGTLGSDGWRTVYYNVQAPNGTGGAEKVSKFRVTGQTTDGQKLYRDITIHVLPRQTFSTPTVTTSGQAINSTVTVSMALPTGLPSSVFPLQILFEDQNHYLNPNGTDMPVNVGPTLTGGTGTSFQFTKSVSWTEYTASNTITAVFKRIKTGQTVLYYSNEYFTTANVTIPAQ